VGEERSRVAGNRVTLQRAREVAERAEKSPSVSRRTFHLKAKIYL
jgi:hypothetical protein